MKKAYIIASVVGLVASTVATAIGAIELAIYYMIWTFYTRYMYDNCK